MSHRGPRPTRRWGGARAGTGIPAPGSVSASGGGTVTLSGGSRGQVVPRAGPRPVLATSHDHMI